EPLAQVAVGGREGEDGHDLRGDRDDELGVSGDAVLRSAEADPDMAKLAIVEVDRPRPVDRVLVDAEGVAVEEVVVEERREQVVGGADGMDVAGQAEIDVRRRDELREPAACAAALHPEERAHGRLAQGDRGTVAGEVERLGQPDRGCGLAHAGGGRGDRRDDDLAPDRLVAQALERLESDLRRESAVQLDLVRQEADLLGDLGDRTRVVVRRNRFAAAGRRVPRAHSRPAMRCRARLTSSAGPVPRAACTNWPSRIALVSGPTPPGTGVIAETTVHALS